jgi:hypothetical protein
MNSPKRKNLLLCMEAGRCCLFLERGIGKSASLSGCHRARSDPQMFGNSRTRHLTLSYNLDDPHSGTPLHTSPIQVRMALPRAPTDAEWNGLRDDFPNLDRNDVLITDEATEAYNCFAFTFGITNDRIWPRNGLENYIDLCKNHQIHQDRC